MTGRWFTNTAHKSDVAEWQRRPVGSRIVAGPPRHTVTATVDELMKQKMHGLYEVAPGVPPLPRAEDCPGYAP